VKILQKYISITLIIIITFSSFGINILSTHADSSGKEVIFVVDPNSENQYYSDFIYSLIGTLKELREESQYKFFSLNSPHKSLIFDSNAIDSDTQIENLLQWMKNDENMDSVSVLGVITEIVNELTLTNAAEGSVINFIVNDNLEISSEESKIIGILLETITSKKWILNFIYKYDTDKTLLDKYKTWAEWTTGSIYPMVTPDTIELITQNTIKQHAERILTNDYKGIIEENSIFQQEIFVSPGTSELEIVMLRTKTEGNVEIITPGGINRTAGNYGPTDLLETPFVSIWKFTDPTPGKWLFKISDYNSGLLSIFHRNKIDYNIQLINTGPFPTGNSVQLVANMVKGSDILISNDAYVELIFDNKISYEMNDNGVNGDAYAEDGYYSMIIPDVNDPGQYDVEIKYSWPSYGTSISDLTKINFELFPYIVTDPVTLDDINLNQNTSIAIIESYLDEEEYYINLEDIKWAVSADALEFDIKINPVNPIQDGRASKFEAILSTTNYGKANISFSLNSMYKNQTYVVYSNSIVITTIPEPIIEKVIVKEEPKKPVDVIQDKIDEQSNLVIILSSIVAVIIILILLIGIILMINYSRRVSIRGYIYDDKNNLIIDINSIPRSFQNKILNRNKIKGEEFDNDLFNGLLFEYMPDYMIIHNYTGKSLRINNQPLIKEKEIFNKAWLGISGNLLLYSDDKL
tara:strand:+ start:41 stop:2116 length:2076 start_codon:yes stop_codon:yes gene_type:complete